MRTGLKVSHAHYPNPIRKSHENIIRSVVVAGVLTLLPLCAMAQSGEHDAVDRTMQKVMHAFEAGDANLAFEVLRKDGVVIGYSPARGGMVIQTAEEWVKGFTGPPADEAQRHRSYEILDVTGNAAVVKVLLDYPGWEGVDHLALSKVEGSG
ncbi:nuclear transport factor 2 family protein [Stenotrophomonas sp. Iso1]|uniref:nuclear transport factor 2 family protein n=1 Tax=Stenotrophomonas sp. Iso1 TaxID=2977283 RepID=UPI0022B7BE40|nr:nuclear transport factor 2 family protein [Stenotrophomonas sp. Iso1]